MKDYVEKLESYENESYLNMYNHSTVYLQMEPLLHDCLIYCHAQMNDIVKTSTNLACLSDALLNRYRGSK